MATYAVRRDRKRSANRARSAIYADILNNPQQTDQTNRKDFETMGVSNMRSRQQHQELIEKVIMLHKNGVGATEIQKRLGALYNADYKTITNIIYRHAKTQYGEAPDNAAADMESRREQEGWAELDADAAETIAHPPVREPQPEQKAAAPEKTEPADEAPDLTVLMHTRSKTIKIRCDHPLLKVQIDVQDPAALRHVAQDLTRILTMAGGGNP